VRLLRHLRARGRTVGHLARGRSPGRARSGIGLVATILAAVAAVAFVAGCGGVPRGAVAKVGGVPISTAQFDQCLRELVGPGTALPRPGSAAYRQDAAAAVTSLVQQQVVLNAAAALGLHVSDQLVQAELARMAAADGGVPRLYAVAARSGLDGSQLLASVKDAVLGRAVYQRVSARFAPTVAQLRSYYASHRARFSRPATRTVRQVLLRTRKQALLVRALLAADPSAAGWARVARRYSIDPASRDRGGDLGAIERGQMVEPFDRAAFSLPLDTVSQPVRSRDGWHVLEVTAVTPATVVSFAAARASITSTLTAQRWQYWLDWTEKGTTIVYAPGFDPAKLTAAASSSPSPSPTKAG
jgi:parvulin-like peptidyl-prolyl isomerase